jgi:uncharacterized membrane protein (UPF0127 family)
MLSVAALSCGGGVERVTVSIGAGASIHAELALTPAARALGLGERDALDRDAGMLFVPPKEGRESFWMKGMRFPLDFVWISSDKRVLQVTEDVPPPAAGTANSALPLYLPDVPVRYVLEINAGQVRALGIKAGEAVTFKPEVDIGRVR